MERLSQKTIELTANLIKQMKNVVGSSVSLEVGEQLIETIEAQQQEIEQHIKWNEAHTKARVEQAELIDKLVRDKDEQAGRIMRLEEVLRQTKRAINKHNAFDIAYAISAIDALLGGKEDE